MQENYPYDAVLIDSCAFDPKCTAENQTALEIFELGQSELLFVGIAHSTEKEIEHPNTPAWVKQKALELIFTVDVGLTQRERQLLVQIEQILAGNGKIEKFKSDAEHIFEAQKYGANFITTDGRILKKAPPLQNLCKIRIFKPSEYLFYFKRSLRQLPCRTRS